MPRSTTQSSRPVTKMPALATRPPSSVVVHPPSIEKPGFGQLVKEGIGFGAGQAIAHRAVNAFFPTAPTVSIPKIDQPSACFSERTVFESCMRTKSQEDVCTNEYLSYKQCIELSSKVQ